MATSTNDAQDTIDGRAAAQPAGSLGRLGLSAGHVVQELGYDEDVDHELRDRIEDLVGGELVDGDYGDVVDVCLLWFREEDGDLTDAVVDALTDLDDQGFVVVLTPKAGREGHVAPSDLAEAATTAGLHVSGTVACPNWVGTRLVAPRSARR